jgi:hypothetical protein
MKYLILVMTAVTLGTSSWAQERPQRKFALVVGGPDKVLSTASTWNEKKTTHEFAQSTARVSYGLRQQGYEVVTLFDSAGVRPAANSNAAALQRNLPEDFAQLRSMGAGSASKQTIIDTLMAVAQNGQSGDLFEFTLYAHGYRSCNGDNGGASGGVSTDANLTLNRNDNCEHMIALTNPVTGLEERIATRELQAALKAIDEKGINTNLTLTSCHSGAAQEIFPREDFPNTCVAFLASANNVGFGCFPSDAAGDQSFTSTLDMVMASHYMPFADEMLQHDYFKKDPCLANITNYYRRSNIEPAANRYELFMNARRNDRMPHEPSISSQLDYEYFRRGKFSAVVALIKGVGPGELCFEPIEQQIQELLREGGEAVSAVSTQQINRLLQRMQQDMDAYNRSLGVQERLRASMTGGNAGGSAVTAEEAAAADAMFARFGDSKTPSAALPPVPKGETAAPAAAPTRSGPTPEQVTAFEAAQTRTMELANVVMESERAIIDIMDRQFLRSRIATEDPCLRRNPLPRQAVAQ